jgi:peptide-methionine (S)-S-oxide reductase
MNRLSIIALGLLMQVGSYALAQDATPAKLPMPRPGEAVATFAGG